MRIIIPIAAALCLACNTTPTCYQATGRYEMVNMPVTVTGGGHIALDDPNGELDASLVDAKAQRVLSCLQAVTPSITDYDLRSAWCMGRWTTELRSCLVVKAAPVWRVSSCTGNQVFTCEAPDESCRAKDQIPTDSCPCSCRAAIQDDGVIVTTPNLELLPWRLVELLTGCEQIQNVPKLAACGDPAI